MANYIKIMRELKEKSFYAKDSEKVHLWLHLLLSANWSEREELLGGRPIKCKAGQFTTGRKQLSIQTGISESKIERILTYFEKIEQQIAQQKTNTNRLISILNWEKYQVVEQRNKQRVNNDRTTSEQQVNTLQENKEYKEEEENIYRHFAHLKMSLSEFDKLIELGYAKEQIDYILDAIQNYKKNSKYISLYLTANNWLKKEYGVITEKQPISKTLNLYLIPNDDLFGYDQKTLYQMCLDGKFSKRP